MADGGMTWGTWVALAGVAGNPIWNFVNYISNRTTRRNTVQLSNFNANVRNVIIEVLSRLEAVMDSADDIARSNQTHTEKLRLTAELSKEFHAARRILARRLNDCDRSMLVQGNDWARCDEGHMDTATAAFDGASRAVDDSELRTKLLDVARAINSLHGELCAKLDGEASRLMD